MQILSQRDPRWASAKMGESNATLGRYGCTTTCVSMALDYFVSVYPSLQWKNPGKLAQTLDYTADGLILWGSLSKIGLSLVKRGYGRNDHDIKQALKDPKTCVILQVQGNHWVLATGTNLFGRYKISDPWFGDRATAGRYKDQITGYAIISKL